MDISILSHPQKFKPNQGPYTFQPISKKLRDSDLVWFFQVSLSMEPNLRYIASKIIPPIISLQFF